MSSPTKGASRPALGQRTTCPRTLSIPGSSRPTTAAAVRAAYVGEGVKLLATLILFAGCFVLVQPLHIGALLGVFAVLIVVHAAGFAYLTRHDTA